MKKTKFTETQIVSILKQQEAGIPTKEICRQNGISEATFYNWKSRYGGMEASDVKRLKDLEEENSRLKKMFADLSLDNQILKEPVRKKGLGSAAKRELTEEIVREHNIAVSRACKIVNLVRSQYYYSSKRDDSEVIESLQDLAFKHPSYGFRKLFAYLRRSGKLWNHKRVHRIYQVLKLNKRRKGKRRLPDRVKQPLVQPAQVNETWSVDFMSDSMIGNRKFRTFNVIDDCSREALAIEIDTSLSSKRITRVLERIGLSKGFPKAIRSDNGPEFTSKDFAIWCADRNIETRFIQPGKPMQNGFIERFNRLYREAVLDAYLFFDLDQVRQLTAEWIDEYNHRRPHEGLGNMTPFEWKDLLLKKEIQQQMAV
ncbi:IS3 family transposase [Dyadobacter sp. CY351]|uniref:IS3 family transposase n=1 Tax=Dyadobacter sp. CY351 TaxID=2909337 RepID=UPI001F16E2D2|nr:IS3 family transposase [Dyadobacter sp. CY351]MCF2521145.1 IS3 family transposase [Dyadobacter sp. CY351]